MRRGLLRTSGLVARDLPLSIIKEYGPCNTTAAGQRTGDYELMARIKSSKPSPSAAIKAQLDYPVIDTDVHTNDYSPAVDDYVATYAGPHLVDELRKATAERIDRGNIG